MVSLPASASTCPAADRESGGVAACRVGARAGRRVSAIWERRMFWGFVLLIVAGLFGSFFSFV